ncbi:MAG: hypothetical protein CM15mP25_3150 [Gammaproteobacteria bacterium]|nr:MAG: hypothetical protein CM15mP25_3150 [Gammaproteobacteria bacterium]
MTETAASVIRHCRGSRSTGWPEFSFADQRLPEMLFRYRARNFPDTLSDEEAAQWREHCQLQWQEGSFSLAQFETELAEERARPEVTEITLAALNQLEEWVRALSVEG